MKKAVSLVLGLALLFCLALPASATGETVQFRASQVDPAFEEILSVCAAAIAEAAWPGIENREGAETKVSLRFSSVEKMEESLRPLKNAGAGEENDGYSILFFDKILPLCYDELLKVEVDEYDGEWHYTEYTADGHYRKKVAGPTRTEGLTECSFSVSGEHEDMLRQLLQIADEACAAAEDDRGRLEYINRWLIDHVTYGRSLKYLAGYLDDGTQVYWNNGGQSVKELLEDGMAVCAGYTHTTSYLCFLLGIPNVELSTAKHTWNLVFVDGEWKMLDTTWDDSTGREYAFFLVDEIPGADHDWLNSEEPETIEAAKLLAAAVQERIALLKSLEEGPISVRVGEENVGWTDALPFIDENGRTLVPLRAVANALELEVSWDAASREAIFSGEGRTIRFPIGSQTAYTTEGELQMDTAAIIRNDRTYAPIRWLAEYFGCEIGWDGSTRTVLIG